MKKRRGENRNFLLLAISVFCLNVGFGVYFATFNNFIVERIGIRPEQLGFMEALRETPGFLSAAFNALVSIISAPIVGGASLIVMGFGIGSYSQVHTLLWLVLFSLIWSIGFHGWAPLQGTMALAFSEEGRKGERLGQLRSVGGFAYLFGLLLAISVSLIDYSGVYLLAGVIIAIGGVTILFASWNRDGIRETRFLFRWRYGIYYALNFMQGCRKQIFVVFAVFTLVKVYGISVQTVITLMVINQIVTIFTGPLMGRFVDRYGERKMLSLSYLGLIFVFMGYALIHNPWILFLCYCLDNFLYFGAIALTTYINRIAPPQDIRPTLSMGVTMNHVAAILTPLFGGLLWEAFSYEVIFAGGAFVALISLLVSRMISPN
ncbi:TPA: MFS transporter [Candidatus Poribacteria bacterium]|nr:MFS transporter [Candidatus Poribacteria bacterium]